MCMGVFVCGSVYMCECLCMWGCLYVCGSFVYECLWGGGVYVSVCVDGHVQL